MRKWRPGGGGGGRVSCSVVFRSCVLINLEYRHVGVCRIHCTLKKDVTSKVLVLNNCNVVHE